MCAAVSLCTLTLPSLDKSKEATIQQYKSEAMCNKYGAMIYDVVLLISMPIQLKVRLVCSVTSELDRKSLMTVEDWQLCLFEVSGRN
jgi:hypothetical protein